jgi:peptide chain release factor subunit 1
MLIDLKEIDIKNLSEIYDLESKESFVSLYMNMEKTNERFVEKRKKACRSVLKENRELIENFDKTMQKIEKYLGTNDREHGQKGLVIFASNEHDFFKSYKLGMPVEDLMVVDASPYIRPVAKLIEDYETFGLVVLDNHRARIYVVSSGRIEDKDKIARDIMKKHKKGGMSQARFQRLRRGAIEHFMKEVSEEMVRLFSKDNVVKIVIAGPGEAKILLLDFLPNELKDEILDSIDVDFDEADVYLISKAEGAVMKDEKETVSKNVIRLKEEILKHSLAVYCLEDLIEAVKNGHIELLLVSKGYNLQGWICEKCQLLDSGIKDKCPNCGGKVSEVDVIEEIIEFAERTDTKIEFVDDNPILQELGGVGGLLRFKITP